MIRCKEDMEVYPKLSTEEQKDIQMQVAHYHYRNLRKNSDGSLGTIDVGSHQFREELAKAFERGRLRDD